MKTLLLVGLLMPVLAFGQATEPNPPTDPSAQILSGQGEWIPLNDENPPTSELVEATSPTNIEVELPKLQVFIPELTFASEAAFAVNLDTQDVVIAKNQNEIRSIASITKMMTSYVVLQSQVDLSETITIMPSDVAFARRANRPSRLRPGMHFTRERLLNLALMYSENVAATALGRTTFSGGTEEFVEQMNKTAVELQMTRTNFVDPIGIGIDNVSTASDLVRLVAAASTESVIREFSTTKFLPVQFPIKHSNKPFIYNNTNALVNFKDWNILLQKTGFTNAAGHCVVMIVEIQGEHYAVIVLDSPNNQQRAYDAIKIRQWLEEGKELTTDEAKPLSPYKFVLVTPKHKHHRHRKNA